MRLGQDLRYSLRSLRSTPGFTATALVTLALGLGASIAIFSFVSGVLLEPLPFPGARDLVVVTKGNPGLAFQGMYPDSAEWNRWRQRSGAIEMLSGHRGEGVSVLSDDGAERVTAALIQPGMLEMVGRVPSLGRDFTAAEFEEQGDPVVILSRAFWQERLGGRQDVLGETLRIDDGQRTIVGVLPAEPALPMIDADLVFPLQLTAENLDRRASGAWLMGFARLRDGVSLEVARDEFGSLLSEIEEEQPTPMDGWVPELVPLPEKVVGDTSRALGILFGAVLMVLLIACANVTSLLLARGRRRRDEMALRSALGASSARLVRQSMTESLVLAGLGGAAGLLLAFVFTRWIVALAPANLPRLEEVGVDPRVLLFALLLTVVSSVVFGLLPALGVARSRLGGSRGVVGSDGPGSGAREALVVGQIAIALILLVGSGLLVRSLVGLLAVEPGFETRQIVRATVSVPTYRYREPAEQNGLVLDLVERLRRLPMVEEVAATAWSPLSGSWSRSMVVIDGADQPEGENQFAHSWMVSPGYFSTLGVPLLEGRDFDARDFAGREWDDRPRQAIVNRTMAQRYWPGGTAVGGRFRNSASDDSPWVEIIGVVADVRATELGAEPIPGYYRPYDGNGGMVPSFEIVARTAGGVEAAGDVLRAEISAFDPEIPVRSVSALSQVVERHLARPRFQLAVLGALGFLALALAAVGVYGAMAYNVSQRRREIGVRVALGATRREILRLVGRRGGRMVLAGTLLGTLGALAATRVLEGVVQGVSTRDPTSFVLGIVVLTSVALVAVVLPSRRATRVDPLEALRRD